MKLEGVKAHRLVCCYSSMTGKMKFQNLLFCGLEFLLFDSLFRKNQGKVNEAFVGLLLAAFHDRKMIISSTVSFPCFANGQSGI